MSIEMALSGLLFSTIVLVLLVRRFVHLEKSKRLSKPLLGGIKPDSPISFGDDAKPNQTFNRQAGSETNAPPNHAGLSNSVNQLNHENDNEGDSH